MVSRLRLLLALEAPSRNFQLGFSSNVVLGAVAWTINGSFEVCSEPWPVNDGRFIRYAVRRNWQLFVENIGFERPSSIDNLDDNKTLAGR